MNISNTIATRISNWNRNRKWSLFMDIFKPAPETKVLDAGYIDIESKASDNYIEKHYPYPQNLTALGIEEPVHFHANYPDIKTVRYGGRIFPFMDKEFDICYSSAVIEHVGNRESQLEFLKEIRRVSKKAFITTPNRNFPVEVHTRIPLLHFLPKKIFDAFLKMIGKEWATGDYMNLLTYKEIESLLIDAGIEDYKIVKNRFLFFVMDYAIIINSKFKNQN